MKHYYVVLIDRLNAHIQELSARDAYMYANVGASQEEACALTRNSLVEKQREYLGIINTYMDALKSNTAKLASVKTLASQLATPNITFEAASQAR